MSAFSDVVAAGLGTVAAIAGETVSYVRGDVTIDDLTAVPGTTRHQADDVEGFGIAFVSSDWIFTASDLVIDGQVITPRRGDQVKDAAGRRFDVLVLGDGEQAFRYSDRARTRVRVHTKQIGG